MAEQLKITRPGTQFIQPISDSPDSTACNSSISSLILSTFSSTSSNDTLQTSTTITTNKKKNNFTAAKFRGLGCTASASAQVSVPAAIRASAAWEEKKARKKKKKQQKKSVNIGVGDGGGGGSCMAVEDVWCGPGVGFSADATASVDCVVSRRNVAPRPKIGETLNQNQRERSSFLERRSVNPETISFRDSDPASVSEVFGTRYIGHVQHPSPRGLAEIMMLQNSLLMGGRVNTYDQFRDWRLDVDNMSYEELLDLSDRIGYVSTGLREDEIGRCVRKTKHSNDRLSQLHTQVEWKCSICQDEYEADEDLGKLDCGHSHHLLCIKQWLAQRNACPVCKAAALVRH